LAVEAVAEQLLHLDLLAALAVVHRGLTVQVDQELLDKEMSVETLVLAQVLMVQAAVAEQELLAALELQATLAVVQVVMEFQLTQVLVQQLAQVKT
jgi:hypothetical protein